MDIVVRRARAEDARKIADFAVRLFAQHRDYNSRRFAQISSIEGAEIFYASQTEAEDSLVLVAEADEDIVAFAYLQFEEINYTDLLENAVWLHDLYVIKTMREQNVGSLLIEKSVEAAKKFGADKLMISVASDNEFARNFFKRRGFKTTMVEMMLNLTEDKNND